MNISIVGILVIVLFPAICFAEHFERSKATFYDKLDGACNYGEDVNNGLATVVVFQNEPFSGYYCGMCFQVKCKKKKYCNSKGVKVAVVGEHGGVNGIGFEMNRKAFEKMALPGNESKLISAGRGVADVLFKRVLCHYSDNILLRVSGLSKTLTIDLMNVDPSVFGISRVEVKGKDGDWDQMINEYPTEFFTVGDQGIPKGPLSVRVKVRINNTDKFLEKQGIDVIPSDWKEGAIYDSTFQFNY